MAFVLHLVLTDGAEGKRKPAPNSPEAHFKEGSRLFWSRESSREIKLRGWALMEQAAAANYLPAITVVAEHDAGFVQVYPPSPAFPLLKPNLTRALGLFRVAVDRKDPESMTRLALLYSSGIGEPRHPGESPQNLLLAAAAKNEADAMIHLSDRHLYGHGAKRDLLLAGRWRFLASLEDPNHRFDLVDDDGEAKAQVQLPMAELAEVVSLFIKTAERKNAAAAAALARRYFENEQPVEAAGLFLLALRFGNTSVSQELAQAESLVPAGDKSKIARVSDMLFMNEAVKK